jgi:hypothetical protein
MASITLYDETTLGRKSIRQRINQEVENYNQNQSKPFKGLVQPSDSERLLNGYKLHKVRGIDRDRQFELAISAFLNHGFILLVNDVQVDELDMELELDDSTIVSFLKLTRLVGG